VTLRAMTFDLDTNLRPVSAYVEVQAAGSTASTVRAVAICLKLPVF
jgi:hypothetical protein